MTDMSLAGRTALVTGASRGIGRGIALTLAGAGADIAVNYTRDASADAETVAAIQALGPTAKPSRASVAHAEARAAMVAETETDFGTLSLLVTHAGVPTTPAEPPRGN